MIFRGTRKSLVTARAARVGGRGELLAYDLGEVTLHAPIARPGKILAAGKKVKKLPMSLGEALIELDKDEVIKAALPDEMYRVFTHYKRDEWERFCAAVTDWDVKEYLDILP